MSQPVRCYVRDSLAPRQILMTCPHDLLDWIVPAARILNWSEFQWINEAHQIKIFLPSLDEFYSRDEYWHTNKLQFMMLRYAVLPRVIIECFFVVTDRPIELHDECQGDQLLSSFTTLLTNKWLPSVVKVYVEFFHTVLVHKAARNLRTLFTGPNFSQFSS